MLALLERAAALQPLVSALTSFSKQVVGSAP
jgi:hypothetical protein